METLYSLYKLTLLLIMTARVGIATNFSPTNDPWNPDPHAACLHRDLKETDMIIAHPTLPCKARVWIYNLRTHKSVVARVGDRGPRKAMIDLNIPVTKALKANGM